MTEPGPLSSEEAEVVASAVAGDESAFASITRCHRRELHVHCYRMLGSLQDAEDAVQETFLRAWRSRESFAYRGPSSFRAWLYRVATNACIDLLQKKPRTPFPWQRESTHGPASASLLPPHPHLAWLEPYPDRLLGIVPDEEQPEAQVVARETIELAFIVAVQLLPPTQRAALILRDVLGWSAKETAVLLDTTVAAANSALQRARATLKQHVPGPRSEPSERTAEERAVVRRYMDAHERCDFAALAELLRKDARLTMPPTPSWFEGRDAIVGLFASWLDLRSPHYVGEVRRLAVAANRQPGSAGYLRRPGDSAYRPLGLELLRIENGKVAEITMFVTAELFSAFELPNSL
ncbi:MAG: RNA polymerase subunit sigma-70 [Actinomycetota bacterium]|nr:RNA polymerase subunit sigma-70 [Actinomycetota bacterium]